VHWQYWHYMQHRVMEQCVLAVLALHAAHAAVLLCTGFGADLTFRLLEQNPSNIANAACICDEQA